MDIKILLLGALILTWRCIVLSRRIASMSSLIDSQRISNNFYIERYNECSEALQQSLNRTVKRPPIYDDLQALRQAKNDLVSKQAKERFLKDNQRRLP